MADVDLVKSLLEHREGLFGFVMALTHDRDAAEEVFQEVGLAIVEEARRGTPVQKFLPWVHEMARRRVAEHFRKRARGRSIARLDSLDDAVSLAFQECLTDPRAGGERQGFLEECLEELPPTQREMIDRRYRDRDSIGSIARALEWTEGAVKVALWKVRRRLEGCIEGKLGGAEPML